MGIPKKVRDEVLERSGGLCEYVDEMRDYILDKGMALSGRMRVWVSGRFCYGCGEDGKYGISYHGLGALL